MNIKYLYVLTSTDNDIYYEQTLLSILTLRISMPDAFVTLLTDTATSENLDGGRAKIKEVINELIVIPLDRTLSGLKRSRMLKTAMRNHVNGDFLFIDSDTIILSSLDMPSDFNGEMGAVQNRHTNYFNPSKRQCKKLGIRYGINYDYFNSGVLYVKDTKNTKEFFKRWNELWIYCSNKGYCLLDQPPLAQTNYEYNNIIQNLSGEWNCQICDGINFISNAKIIHIITTHTIMERYIHPMMNKKFFFDMKNNKDVDKLARETISSFKSSFFEGTKIVSPQYDKMAHTSAFVLLKDIYVQLPRFFKIMNVFCLCLLNSFYFIRSFFVYLRSITHD